MATIVAAEGLCRALVLIAPYTSIAAVAALRLPFFPARQLVWDRFDNAARAPTIHIPTLVTHGHADRVIPFEMGEELARRFPNATFLPREKGHMGILDDHTWDRVAELAASPSAP